MGQLNAESLREFESLARGQRHALSNTLAASRLLIGAYATWEIDETTYRSAFEVLKKRDAAAIDLKDHFVLMSELRPTKPKGGVHSLADAFKGRPCLVIDDQLDEAGWRPTLQAILGPGTLFEPTPKAALARLARDAAQTALVLLDLGLPEATDGLAALREIKERHLDLPVIVFSASDEIPLAKRCFAAGASNYYVKELESPDRNSIAYYLKFKETLLGALPDARLRILWAAIQELRGSVPRDESGARVTAYVARSFERAWFFLTADETDPRTRLLFADAPGIGANIFSHALLESVMALERLVDDRYRKIEPERRQRARKELEDGSVRMGKSQFKDKVRRLQEGALLSARETDEILRLWGLRGRVAHGERRIDRPSALDQVSACLQICQKLV